MEKIIFISLIVFILPLTLMAQADSTKLKETDSIFAKYLDANLISNESVKQGLMLDNYNARLRERSVIFYKNKFYSFDKLKDLLKKGDSIKIIVDKDSIIKYLANKIDKLIIIH